MVNSATSARRAVNLAFTVEGDPLRPRAVDLKDRPLADGAARASEVRDALPRHALPCPAARTGWSMTAALLGTPVSTAAPAIFSSAATDVDRTLLDVLAATAASVNTSSTRSSGSSASTGT